MLEKVNNTMDKLVASTIFGLRSTLNNNLLTNVYIIFSIIRALLYRTIKPSNLEKKPVYFLLSLPLSPALSLSLSLSLSQSHIVRSAQCGCRNYNMVINNIFQTILCETSLLNIWCREEFANTRKDNLNTGKKVAYQNGFFIATPIS